MSDIRPLPWEAALQQYLAVIQSKLSHMTSLDKVAFRDAVQAVLTLDWQLAYTVILHHRHVDEWETEVDQLCLEFLVRHQPSAGILQFVYSTSKIVKELEQIGDYAESVARHVLQNEALSPGFPYGNFNEMTNLAVLMAGNGVRTFLQKDADLARTTRAGQDETDALRNQIHQELVRLLPLESPAAADLPPLLTVARRFKRSANQAYNSCEEALYHATGGYQRHRPRELFRIVFVPATNGRLSRWPRPLPPGGANNSSPSPVPASSGEGSICERLNSCQPRVRTCRTTGRGRWTESATSTRCRSLSGCAVRRERRSPPRPPDSRVGGASRGPIQGKWRRRNDPGGVCDDA